MTARHEYGIELVVTDFLNLREADCRRATLRGQLQRVQQRETFLTGLFIAAQKLTSLDFWSAVGALPLGVANTTV